MVASIILVIITMIKGLDVDENPVFIFAEFIINGLVLADFICRVKLLGAKRFFDSQQQP